MDSLLRLEGIGRSFGGVAAVADCSLTFAGGAVTGLIGPNGAGKTTLLNLVCGLVRPDDGTVVFDGCDITGWPAHRIAAAGLVRTFQIVRAFQSLTVLENLLVTPPGQEGEAPGTALLHRGRIRETERANATAARAILERMNLWRLADAPAGTLSGGQRKLLELARALLLAPRMIMLDEPAAGVAPPLVAQIVEIVRDLRDDGMSFVLVEHDMGLVGALCDHVHVMAEGRPLMSGTFAEVTADARVLEAYLGVPA